MTITGNTSVKEIRRIPELEPVKEYLIAGGGAIRKICMGFKIKQFCGHKSTVSEESVIRGINRLLEVSKDNRFFKQVYTSDEIDKDPSKKDVNLVFFPAKRSNENKPYIIICPGGAYKNVFSITEGYPVAAKFNELGYSAFVFTYRVGGKGLQPKPLDDLATALQYIKSHAAVFDVYPDNYILTGFSAGGNLVSLWGTDNHGYSSYGLAKPVAMFPAYPVITAKLFSEDSASDNKILMTMLGSTKNIESRAEYNVDENMSAAYPPCYIVCCEDDDTVKPENSRLLKRRLDELGVSVMLEIGNKGGHGFGEGTGTSVEGWLERAAAFSQKVSDHPGGKEKLY